MHVAEEIGKLTEKVIKDAKNYQVAKRLPRWTKGYQRTKITPRETSLNLVTKTKLMAYYGFKENLSNKPLPT